GKTIYSAILSVPCGWSRVSLIGRGPILLSDYGWPMRNHNSIPPSNTVFANATRFVSLSCLNKRTWTLYRDWFSASPPPCTNKAGKQRKRCGSAHSHLSHWSFTGTYRVWQTLRVNIRLSPLLLVRFPRVADWNLSRMT